MTSQRWAEMSNNYKDEGDTAVLVIKRRDGTVLEVLIDSVDLPRVQSFPGVWMACWDKTVGAFRVNGTTRKRSGMGRTRVCLSRFLMDAPEGLEVDHINHNPLDNRRCNLRVVSKSGNQQNRQGAEACSGSGIRGVSWCKRTGKWRAHIKVNGKKRSFGYFSNIADAEKAVIAARAAHMPYSAEAFAHAVGEGCE